MPGLKIPENSKKQKVLIPSWQMCTSLSSFLAAPVDKSGKRKRIIPKIVVSGPSNEQLTIGDELPETRTIRDTEDYGPYTVHSRPSTVDAYKTTRGEQ